MLQFEPLETACVQYLIRQPLSSTEETLLCLAQFGDHLGLSALLDNAVDALTQKPWVDNMHCIAQILAMPIVHDDVARMSKVLHHPRRGACTELQVLELLEMADMSQNSIAAVLRMDSMQPAELDILLGILVSTKYAHTAGMLLCKAVQQQRLPKGSQPCPDWSACTRIVHNIMMPDTGEKETIFLPHSNFSLKIGHHNIQQDGEQMSQ